MKEITSSPPEKPHLVHQISHLLLTPCPFKVEDKESFFRDWETRQKHKGGPDEEAIKAKKRQLELLFDRKIRALKQTPPTIEDPSKIRFNCQYTFQTGNQVHLVCPTIEERKKERISSHAKPVRFKKFKC